MRAPSGSTAITAEARRRPRPSWQGAAAVLLAALAACAPPDDRAAGATPTLYAAASQDGTVARLDSVSGRALGPPLPAGPAPGQLAGGQDGGLLVLSAARDAARPLTRLSPAGHGAGRAAHLVALPGPTREARLAGDGGRYGVVVDRGPAIEPVGAAPPGCRLTLVDIPTGGAAASASPCGPLDLVTGLALDDAPTGPVAHLALWHLHPHVPGGFTGRVVAVNAQTGAPMAVLPLQGMPVLVALGPAPGRVGRRLYVVERRSDPEGDPTAPAETRLLGLHPTTLEVESERPLDLVPARLAVAPDGDAAYALHDLSLTRLGLAGGPDRSVALPERGLALAVTRDRVYVSSAYGPELWAFGRRDSRLVATLSRGQIAVDLLLSRAE